MRKITVSKTALKNSLSIAEYIEAKFSVKARNEFVEKLEKGFEMIRLNPEMFPKSEINPNRFRFVLTKQTTIYYRFNNSEIRILALFDTRQNPNKIKKDIK